MQFDFIVIGEEGGPDGEEIALEDHASIVLEVSFFELAEFIAKENAEEGGFVAEGNAAKEAREIEGGMREVIGFDLLEVGHGIGFIDDEEESNLPEVFAEE